jgi:anti-anti-sigma factor
MVSEIIHSAVSAACETCDPGQTELVRGNEQALLDRLMPLVQSQSVSLNLESVERIDAAGLAALIRLYCAACHAGHSFHVVYPSTHVAEILSLVGLDELLASQNSPVVSYSGVECQESAA